MRRKPIVELESPWRGFWRHTHCRFYPFELREATLPIFTVLTKTLTGKHSSPQPHIVGAARPVVQYSQPASKQAIAGFQDWTNRTSIAKQRQSDRREANRLILRSCVQRHAHLPQSPVCHFQPDCPYLLFPIQDSSLLSSPSFVCRLPNELLSYLPSSSVVFVFL